MSNVRHRKTLLSNTMPKLRKPNTVRAAAGRRTYGELFVDKLAELTKNRSGGITNRRLRVGLDWDEERYDRIKAQLVGAGEVRVGRGWGGLVALAGSTKSSALKIFISYSHADEAIKNDLQKHLRPLERMDLIKLWHDRKLLPGDTWDKEIGNNLEQADVVLLVVSIDFINSKYCYDIELAKSLERHARGTCRVVPIIARGCMWQHTPFARLQALPVDGLPISVHPNIDQAFATVAEGIRVLAEELLQDSEA